MSTVRMDRTNALKQDKQNLDFILNGKMLIWTNNLAAVRATNEFLIN
jgi:hypothetical protein